MNCLASALLAIAFVQAVHANVLPRELPDDCKYFTVGGCNPATDEIIETYEIPNVENAVSLCQQVCQIQEGCNFFTYDNAEEKCFLFHYRYLDSCQLLGGTAAPGIDECAQELENSCNSFVKEDCTYAGNDVFHKTSVTDAHSCQEILVTLGAVLGGDYFVYDSDSHVCTFYDSRVFTCSGVSGPALPSYDDCNSNSTTVAPTAGPTTAAPTAGPTTAAPTAAPTTAPTAAPTTAPVRA